MVQFFNGSLYPMKAVNMIGFFAAEEVAVWWNISPKTQSPHVHCCLSIRIVLSNHHLLPNQDTLVRYKPLPHLHSWAAHIAGTPHTGSREPPARGGLGGRVLIGRPPCAHLYLWKKINNSFWKQNSRNLLAAPFVIHCWDPRLQRGDVQSREW